MYITNKNTCLICLISSNIKNPVKNMKNLISNKTNCDCNAYFHNDCLNMWLNKSSNCPICLKPIYKEYTNKIVSINYYAILVTAFNIIQITLVFSFIIIIMVLE